MIFSQENLRDEMLSPPGQGGAGRARDPAGVPTVTYRYGSPGIPAVTIHMNGETVDFIPMMPSHTAGDTIVRFNKANVIYIEDFYRNFGYPFADQANGGSIKGMIEAVDLIQKLAGPDTTLVPGHGTLVRRKDLLGYRAMLVEILGKVQKLRDEGKSLDEVLAANLTAPYDATTLGDTKQSKDRFITEVYDEVKDLPPVVNGERKMPEDKVPQLRPSSAWRSAVPVSSLLEAQTFASGRFDGGDPRIPRGTLITRLLPRSVQSLLVKDCDASRSRLDQAVLRKPGECSRHHFPNRSHAGRQLLIGAVKHPCALNARLCDKDLRQSLSDVFQRQRIHQFGVTPQSSGHKAKSVERDGRIRDEEPLDICLVEEEDFRRLLGDRSRGIITVVEDRDLRQGRSRAFHVNCLFAALRAYPECPDGPGRDDEQAARSPGEEQHLPSFQ